jgi:hypothetical protein
LAHPLSRISGIVVGLQLSNVLRHEPNHAAKIDIISESSKKNAKIL